MAFSRLGKFRAASALLVHRPVALKNLRDFECRTSSLTGDSFMETLYLFLVAEIYWGGLLLVEDPGK